MTNSATGSSKSRTQTKRKFTKGKSTVCTPVTGIAESQREAERTRESDQQRQKEVKQDLIDTIKASRRAVDANKADTNKAGLVWCTECATQLRKDERIIKAHFLSAHQVDPSHSLIKAVLNNRQCINGEILTGNVRRLPTDGIPDYDQIHSGKLFGEVQGGGVETNRRK